MEIILTLALFGMVDLDCDAPAAEELGTFFSFQMAVDALEVAGRRGRTACYLCKRWPHFGDRVPPGLCNQG